MLRSRFYRRSLESSDPFHGKARYCHASVGAGYVLAQVSSTRDPILLATDVYVMPVAVIVADADFRSAVAIVVRGIKTAVLSWQSRCENL